MDNQVYKEILKQRDIKRQKKIDEAIIKKNKLYQDYPKLEEIDRKINMMALKITRNIVASDEITRQIEEENMKINLDKLEKEKNKILKQIGIKIEDLEPDFDCKICNDTGVITKDVANKIIFMDEGKILEEGTPEEIFENPKHERVREFIGGIGTI